MQIDLGKAKELFLAVLEMPAGRRASYLDTACAGDAALRQRIEAMLQTHENSGELLPRTPGEMLADANVTDTDGTAAFTPHPQGPGTFVEHQPSGPDDLSFLQPSDKPGHLGRLGHYEILEVIGKGGFGTVLRAFDERLHRVVAVKVLSPAFAANGAARRRFIREARTAAAVKNEHVVAIHDVQEDANPPYLVMEMIDGTSLQDKIDKQGPLSIKEILRIGLQTAEGLAAAHKQGLVHRDIKPANILLENGVERVKITDFGLARAVDDASVTQSGTVAGTPMYMSPEQAEGLQIDHRSDLFSLGTVLYAMCTGHPPFRASGTHAVLKRVIDASPRPIREINNEIPDWLEGIIAKLHAKKPEDRVQTAKEVAELLGQRLADVQAGRDIASARRGSPDPAGSPDRRSPSDVSAGSGDPRRALEPTQSAPRITGAWPVWPIAFVGLLLAALVPVILYLVRPAQAVTLIGLIGIGYVVALYHWLKAAESNDTRPSGPTIWPVGLVGLLILLLSAVFFLLLYVKHGEMPFWHWGGGPVLILVIGEVLCGLWLYVRLRSSRAPGRLAATLAIAESTIRPLTRLGSPRRMYWILGGLLVASIVVILANEARYWFADAVFAVVSDDPNSQVTITDADNNLVYELKGSAAWGETLRPTTYTLAIRPGPGRKFASFGWAGSGKPTFTETRILPDGRQEHRFEVTFQRGKRLLADIKTASLVAAAAEPGWVQLFNGKDLKGWRQGFAGRPKWNVVNGVIIGDDAESPLQSEQMFQNFHCRIRFKLPGAGAAQFGFRKSADSFVEATLGSNLLDGNGSLFHSTGEKHELLVRSTRSLPDDDRWSTLDVIVIEKKVVIKVNGTTSAEKTIDGMADRGHIELALGRQGSMLQIRTIEINELPSEPPLIVVTPEAVLQAFQYRDFHRIQGAWRLRVGVEDLGNGKGKHFVDLDTDKSLPDEFEFDVQGVRIVVARSQMAKLRGSTLGYHAYPDKQGFYIVNPNFVDVPDPGDHDRLQGLWVAESVEADGKLAPAALRDQVTATFTGKKIRVTNPGGKVHEGTYRLEESAHPKKLEVIGADRIARFGLYKFDGDRLVLCLGEDEEKDRPTEFTSKGGKQRLLVFLKRRPLSEPGWVQLFNGKDLTGWVPVVAEKPGVIWHIADGSLIFKKAVPPASYLRTAKAYQNYQMQLDFRFPSDTGKLVHTGSLRFKSLRPGEVPEGVTPWFLTMELFNNLMCSVGIDRSPKPLQSPPGLVWASLPPGEWNRLLISCQEGSWELSINGRLVTKVANYRPGPGFISLTAWNLETHLRDIKIKELPPFDRFINSLGMEFARIPKGKSWLGGGLGKMGDNEVEFKEDFYLGVYEVTQEEWQKVMEKNPSYYSRTGGGNGFVATVRDENLKRFPVDNVSWEDCQDFLKRLNATLKETGWKYRLPTEAEWEYACRGGPMQKKEESAFQYYWNTPTDIFDAKQANALATELNRPNKVGSYGPNRLGLFDMHGNVEETCDDDLGLAKVPPHLAQRPYRGGYFNGDCRATNRSTGSKFSKSNTRGLRVARVPVLPEEPGWVQLFNGKDLDGWQQTAGPPLKWKVQDGVLTIEGTTSLSSNQEFRDFHCRIEAKTNAEGLASFFFRRAPNQLTRVSIGKATGKEHRGSLRFNLNGTDQIIALQEKELVQPDAWFNLEVVARGRHVTVLVNGVKTADATIDSLADVGQLLLAGGTDKTVVHFKKIEIKELPPEEPGWLRLFNGKDLTGWRASRHWTIKDGLLSGDTALMTERDDFENYHLKVVLKLEPGSECQIEGRFKPEESTKTAGQLCFPLLTGERLESPAGQAYKKLGTKPVPANRWFTCEIIADGKRRIHKVDGQTLYDAPERGGINPRGHICLTGGGPPGLVVQRIDIKELPPTAKAGPADIEKALQALEGTWELTAREVDGKNTPLPENEKATFTFKDGKYVHRIGDKITGTGTITIDPAARPLAITIKHDVGTAKDMPLAGIYEITADGLRMALSEPGGPRPTRFESANKQALENWRRVKEQQPNQ